MSSFSDIQNFNRLFNEYYERFIRFALSYVKEQQIAEDFVTEAFTSYWEKRHQLSCDSKPPAYILTTIKNKCLNYLQNQKVQLRVKEELRDHYEWVLNTRINTLGACDPDFLFSDEIQRIIESTLKELPQKTRQIFVLSRFEGLSYKEIAEKMNLSTKSIEFHISKALGRLRLSLVDFICISLFLFYFC
jgi:RNA polymerase sigma-70 factor (ECF subfamily)